jgi:hypothetical protein
MGKGDVARSRPPRPELVCWKEGMAWVVGVEVPDELAEQDLRVLDGKGNDLEEDQVHELRWPLMDPLGPVTVRWSDGAAIEAERRFDASRYRAFKVVKSGVSGRRVSRVTRGHYVVIAPRALTRDEAVGGTAPVAPENVIPEQAGILAHHLLVEEETDELMLGRSGTASVEVRPYTATAYKLLGHRIEDAHTRAGALFGREPPRLRVEGVAEPALFVVGVEGPSIGRRSRQVATSFDELRHWLDDEQPGWFFVRAYDANDELLESLDFRYARDLEAIEIDEHSPLPSPQGHRPVKVVLRVAPGVVVSPVDGPPEITSLDSAPAEGVFLPARPDAARATWRMRLGAGNGVEVVVHAPRVWWAFTADGDEEKPHAWTDGVQPLSTDDLLPTSPMRLSVLLPEPGWADEVSVGFRDGLPRRVPVPRSERVLHYPLRNLGEDDAVRRADGPCDLLMSVRTGATEHGPVVVGAVQLTADRVAERKRGRRLDLSCLSAPRLMSEITRLGRLGTAKHRRAIKVLRKTWYQGGRRGGSTKAREFIRQALALAAAINEREPTLRLHSRWHRRAQLLAEQEPTAVASWQRTLKASEPRVGLMVTDVARGEARQA